MQNFETNSAWLITEIFDCTVTITVFSKNCNLFFYKTKQSPSHYMRIIITKYSLIIPTVHSNNTTYVTYKITFNLVHINTLNPELNPICSLLALLAHHFLHVSRTRVKSLTLRLLMSYVYIWNAYS